MNIALTDFPDELIMNILQFVTNGIEVVHVLKTCKLFNYLMREACTEIEFPNTKFVRIKFLLQFPKLKKCKAEVYMGDVEEEDSRLYLLLDPKLYFSYKTDSKLVNISKNHIANLRNFLKIKYLHLYFPMFTLKNLFDHDMIYRRWGKNVEFDNIHHSIYFIDFPSKYLFVYKKKMMFINIDCSVNIIDIFLKWIYTSNNKTKEQIFNLNIKRSLTICYNEYVEKFKKEIYDIIQNLYITDIKSIGKNIFSLGTSIELKRIECPKELFPSIARSPIIFDKYFNINSQELWQYFPCRKPVSLIFPISPQQIKLIYGLFPMIEDMIIVSTPKDYPIYKINYPNVNIRYYDLMKDELW